MALLFSEQLLVVLGLAAMAVVVGFGYYVARQYHHHVTLLRVSRGFAYCSLGVAPVAARTPAPPVSFTRFAHLPR
jgi:hypothetical protein